MSIALTSSGVVVVCWGDVLGPVMWVRALFCNVEVLVGGVVSVWYDACVSTGMSGWFLYVCQVGWTRVDDCVESLGSLRCGVLAGRRGVVLRVSMLVRSWRSNAYCPLCGSLLVLPPCFVCVFEYYIGKIW